MLLPTEPLTSPDRRCDTSPCDIRWAALIGAALLSGGVLAQPAATPVDARQAPVILTADQIRSVIDQSATAEGEVELRQAGLTLTADTLVLDQISRTASVHGHVRLDQDGNRFSGTEARVQLDTREGSVLAATYFLARTGAGGRAARIDFTGTRRVSALNANYSSCPVDANGQQDWVLSADRLDLDFEHNDGHARGAVLHFLGVPILAGPGLSFPATGERRSGWLPPSISTDSRSGFGLEVPWYWNLAPNYDLTLTPGILTRRGASLGTEFRYLLPSQQGGLQTHWMPWDSSVGRNRYALVLTQDGRPAPGWAYSTDVQAASDNNYWKDFSGVLPSLTPRLLQQDARASYRWQTGESRWRAYARVEGWQVMQDDTALILPPYQRLPQLGLSASGRTPAGLVWSMQSEVNHFALRDQWTAVDTRGNGTRAHLLGALTHPGDVGWGWLAPSLSFNAAAYDTAQPMSDGRQHASRTIPTLSIDGGLRLDRDTRLLGRDVTQTLIPRLHYVNTPWRNQDALPAFDAAAYDFNEVSIYGNSAFSGVDYVNDANQVTMGATSSWADRATGAELMRLGVAQRYQFRPSRITADRLTVNGLAPATPGATSSPFSDLMLFGSTTLLPHWRLDATEDYNAAAGRTEGALMAVHWQPGPFRTLSATYRYTRGVNEQVELGWQWPVYRGRPSDGSTCNGTLYGVGRVNYSMMDSRITDAIAGLEYDAGCWIGRLVAQRQSTGASEATTRLMIQLELVGLSRLGSNPLKVLKDNIPGYQMLRDDGAPTATPTAP